MNLHRWFYLVAFFGYVAITLIIVGVSFTSIKFKPIGKDLFVYPYYMLGLALTTIGAISTGVAAVCARLGVKEWSK